MARAVFLFDVNETLLDMSALDPAFERAFGTAAARQQWFHTLQVLWMTATLTKNYQPFEKLARAALEMTVLRQGRDLARTEADAILESMKALPPYGDVAPALTQLRDLGFRLAALTNGTLKGLRAQLRHARLTDAFDALFSADEVEAYKPAATPYLYAAKRLELKARRLYLVSAHAWDIAGASAAGLGTVFVRRPRKVLNPNGPKPDITVSTLTELAANIEGSRWRRRRR